MIQIEDTYFELAEGSQQNCLVICDRGCMDATACKYTVPSLEISDNCEVESMLV